MASKRGWVRGLAGLGVLCGLGCGGAMSAPMVSVDEDGALLTATVGPSGGLVEAPTSVAFQGFGLSIPAGALGRTATLRVRRVEDDTPLPTNAFRVGAQFQVEGDGVTLAQPISVRLPVDGAARNSFGGNPEDVKVWIRNGSGWMLVEPTSTSASRVLLQTTALTTMAAGVRISLTASAPSLCGGASLPCGATQLFEPAVGHAPAPCTVTGGFCVEPLVGGANNPAPTATASMFVGQGFVTYAERVPTTSPPTQPRGIQLRMSDLAVLAGARAPFVGPGNVNAQLPSGAIYSGTSFQRFLGIDNTPPPLTSVQLSGQPMGTVWTTPTATTARNFRIQGSPQTIAIFDVNAAGARTALPSIPASEGALFLGPERGSDGTLWVVQATVPFAQQQQGLNAGVLRRIGPDGTLGVSIADTSPPSLLLVDFGGGGGGFGSSGAPGGTSGPSVFYANTRRMVVSGFTGTNTPPRLLVADLTAQAPTLAPLNVTTPTQATNGVDGFRAAVIDTRDRVWFLFGGAGHEELFVFDPANNSTQGVPLTGFRPLSLGFDGTNVIVGALSTDAGVPAQLFRVRPFGS